MMAAMLFMIVKWTAERLGFSLEKTGLFERINLILNIADLLDVLHCSWLAPNSVCILHEGGKDLWGDLIRNKGKLEELHASLTRESL